MAWTRNVIFPDQTDSRNTASLFGTDDALKDKNTQLESDYIAKVVALYEANSDSPVFDNVRNRFNQSNLKETFEDNKMPYRERTLYPDMLLKFKESPAQYINQPDSLDPTALKDLLVQGKQNSLDLQSKVEELYQSANMYRNTVGDVSVKPTFKAVAGQQDHERASSISEQSAERVTGPTFDKSFPTFKIYLIEDNLAGSDSFIREFDNFFDYSAVIEIEVARFKHDVDVAVIKLLNGFNKLTTRIFTQEEQEERKLYGAPYDPTVANPIASMKRLADGGLVQVDEKTGQMSPLNSLFLQPGVKLMIKMGYTNNELELPTVFTGTVVRIVGSEVLTVVAQGFLSELTVPASYVTDQIGGKWAAFKVGVLGINPESSTIGSLLNGLGSDLKKVLDGWYYLGRMMLGAVNAFEGGEFGFTDAEMAQRNKEKAEARIEDLKSQILSQLRADVGSTRNVIYELLQAPSAKHFGAWFYKRSDASPGAASNNNVNAAYGTLWQRITGQESACLVNVDVALSQHWQTKSCLYDIWPKSNSFKIDRSDVTTLWDAMRESVYRNPSHIITVRGYGSDASVVCKEKTDYYKTGAISFNNPSDPNMTNDCNLIQTMMGDPEIQKLFPFEKLTYTAVNLKTIKEKGNFGPLDLDVPVDFLDSDHKAYENGEYISVGGKTLKISEETLSIKKANYFKDIEGTVTWALCKDLNTVPADLAIKFGSQFIRDLVDSDVVGQMSPGTFASICSRSCNITWVKRLFPEVGSALETAKKAKVNMLIEQKPELQGSMMATTDRPIKMYFLASSRYNLIYNNIKLNDQIYNTVRVQMHEDDQSDINAICFDDDIPENYRRVLNYGSTNTMHKERFLIFKTQSTAKQEDMCKLYGMSILKEELERMYQGEVCILGEPDIMPFDSLVIDDAHTQLFGTVEVASVIHHFNQREGYITFIEPHLVCEVSNMSVACATGIMKNVVHSKHRGLYFQNMQGWSNSNMNKVIKEESDITRKQNRSTISGDDTSVNYQPAPTSGTALGTGLYPSASLSQWWDNQISGMLSGQANLGGVLGMGFFEPWMPPFLQLFDPFFEFGALMRNWAYFRQPIIMSPLNYRHIPFVAGIRGAKDNSLTSSLSLRWDRYWKDYNRGQNAFIKGVKKVWGDLTGWWGDKRSERPFTPMYKNQ